MDSAPARSRFTHRRLALLGRRLRRPPAFRYEQLMGWHFRRDDRELRCHDLWRRRHRRHAFNLGGVTLTPRAGLSWLGWNSPSTPRAALAAAVGGIGDAQSGPAKSRPHGRAQLRHRQRPGAEPRRERQGVRRAGRPRRIGPGDGRRLLLAGLLRDRGARPWPLWRRAGRYGALALSATTALTASYSGRIMGHGGITHGGQIGLKVAF